jgi:hypothetical protein
MGFEDRLEEEKPMSQSSYTREFTAILERFEGIGTWTFLTVPFDVGKIFGKKGQVKVTGEINGVEYRSSFMPHGNGHHFLVVSASIRNKAQVQVGDTVAVTMSPDTGERRIAVPADFQQALQQNAAAMTTFNELSYSNKKKYVDWVEDAKREETRNKRIAESIEQLQKRQH